MRTIARNHTRVIARLRQELTLATRHNGAYDLTGTPVPTLEAWHQFDHGTPRHWPLLRELDPRTGTYEIRVHGKLRYELRPAQPADRIDIVVDRDPDNATDVTVYINGVKTTGPSVSVHVIDPGAGDADHEWLEGQTELDETVPEAVRGVIGELAADYHQRMNHCRLPSCDGDGADR